MVCLSTRSVSRSSRAEEGGLAVRISALARNGGADAEAIEKEYVGDDMPSKRQAEATRFDGH